MASLVLKMKRVNMTTYISIHLGPCLHNFRAMALLLETPWRLLGALSVLRNKCA